MGSSSKSILNEARRFTMVGGLGYLVDVSIFNLLLFGLKAAFELDAPFASKIVATSIAVLVTYFLNSRWTFKQRLGHQPGVGRLLKYLVVSIIGLSFSLVALFISRNIFHLESLLADNVSANIVGVAFAWIFRFFANRKWVFHARS